MEDNEFIVQFDQSYEPCRHKDLAENEPPCDECLVHPTNVNSQKPRCYEKKT